MAVLCTSIFAGISSIQWVACFFADTHIPTACEETGKCNLHTENLIYYFLLSLSVWNISILLNLPFSRVVLSPLVSMYLLEEFRLSVESGCSFFSLESTLFPCRCPLPGKGASASQFPIPVGRSVSLCRMASMYPNIIGTSWPSNQFFL